MNGADKPVGKMPDFVRNVPIKKALDADTILAYEMNGEPLPILHGFPLRASRPRLGRRLLGQMAHRHSGHRE